MKYFIPFLLLLSSCVDVKDDYYCVNEPGGGYCQKMFSTAPIHVDDGVQLFTDTDGKQYTWSQLKQVSVVVPPGTWADDKTMIENLCKQSPSDCPSTTEGASNELNPKADQLRP